MFLIHSIFCGDRMWNGYKLDFASIIISAEQGIRNYSNEMAKFLDKLFDLYWWYLWLFCSPNHYRPLGSKIHMPALQFISDIWVDLDYFRSGLHHHLHRKIFLRIRWKFFIRLHLSLDCRNCRKENERNTWNNAKGICDCRNILRKIAWCLGILQDHDSYVPDSATHIPFYFSVYAWISLLLSDERKGWWSWKPVMKWRGLKKSESVKLYIESIKEAMIESNQCERNSFMDLMLSKVYRECLVILFFVKATKILSSTVAISGYAQNIFSATSFYF